MSTRRNLLKDSPVEEVFTQKELIQKRGWSVQLIQKWLTPIDKSDAQYYNDFICKTVVLYKKSDVYNIESKPQFQQEFNIPRKVTHKKTPPQYDKTSINNIIQNCAVVYVAKNIIEELVDIYSILYVQEHSEFLTLTTSDPEFIYRCMYSVIRDILTTYKEDMVKLKSYKASMSDMNRYNNTLKTKIFKIYPYLRKEN